jgi:hypothetical protein
MTNIKYGTFKNNKELADHIKKKYPGKIYHYICIGKREDRFGNRFCDITLTQPDTPGAIKSQEPLPTEEVVKAIHTFNGKTEYCK